MAHRHIVLFRFRDTIDDDIRFNVLERLRELGSSDGITVWRLQPSSDSRRDQVIALDVLFESELAFQEYSELPAAKSVMDLLMAISSWQIASYSE